MTPTKRPSLDEEQASSTPSTIVSKGVIVRKTLEHFHEPIDPRISISSRPDTSQPDLSIRSQLSKLASDEREKLPDVVKKQANTSSEDSVVKEPFYIDFEEGDKRNPINYSRGKKWAITMLAVSGTLVATSTASVYNLGVDSMTRDLNCTEFQAIIGLSVYTLGSGVLPLITASFSEEFGRLPLYLVSEVIFFSMYIMIALAKNIQTVILARFFQGSFGSTAAMMVGGTIADIWSPKERGLPMSIYTFMAIAGNGFGPVYAGWIQMNPRLQWRWIQWIQMMICGVHLILLPIIMRETRSSILLARLAKKIRKETADNRYRARVEDERESLKTLIFISCTRPVYLMVTEPIVLWIGFAWGVLFCMLGSIGTVFKNLHGFNDGQIGMIFLTMVIGSILGFATTFYQESLYQKYVSARGPESRLYTACIAAILLPTGMFIYAWSSFNRIYWIALAIGIVIYLWAIFIIYVAVFTYLADCYGPYASSALAGQSLARNIFATAFPLFTQQMYRALDYKWANTLFGCVAALMIPIPYVLFIYGPAIRRRSKFSRQVMEMQQ